MHARESNRSYETIFSHGQGFAFVEKKKEEKKKHGKKNDFQTNINAFDSNTLFVSFDTTVAHARIHFAIFTHQLDEWPPKLPRRDKRRATSRTRFNISNHMQKFQSALRRPRCDWNRNWIEFIACSFGSFIKSFRVLCQFKIGTRIGLPGYLQIFQHHEER